MRGFAFEKPKTAVDASFSDRGPMPLGHLHQYLEIAWSDVAMAVHNIGCA